MREKIRSRNNNYSKALKEVYVIFNHIDEETRNKIPNEMMELIEENMDKNYDFQIDEKVNLSEQKLLKETLGLISILYSRYICSEEERKKWDKYDAFVNSKMKE